MKRVPEYLVGRPGRGRQFLVCSFRQLDITQQSCYLLPCIGVIHIIFEYESHYRETKHGLRAKIDLSLDAIHGYFDRNGDKAFHFLRTSSRPSRNDADLRIGKIGKGDDRRLNKTKYSDYGVTPPS